MQVFKCMCLLQNQQEIMHLNIRWAKILYDVDDTLVYGWARIIKDM